MTVETMKSSREFEQKLPNETERKLLPIFPEQLSPLRAESYPIEQFYLSHINEPFSLRIRETFKNGELRYKAALKNTGVITPGGLSRFELPVEVPANLYRYYFDDHTTPVLRKLRADPEPGISVDFYEDDSVQVEVEDAESWPAFTARYGDNFVDVTGDRIGSNEWRAHLRFRRLHEGKEAFTPTEELSSQTIIEDILARRLRQPGPITVHVGGRSGSGKSTIVHEVRARLQEIHLTSEVVSTDDYHRGTSWLRTYNGGQDWTHWDAPIVYDTATMAQDLSILRQGGQIVTREMDWTVAEPRAAGFITMPDVLLIEGIYANSPEISDPEDLIYEMTTPLATCIGRRLLRDLRERPEFADPEKSLLYMLTEAEPAYRAQLAARGVRNA